jgi:hypothetical protein
MTADAANHPDDEAASAPSRRAAATKLASSLKFKRRI